MTDIQRLLLIASLFPFPQAAQNRRRVDAPCAVWLAAPDLNTLPRPISECALTKYRFGCCVVLWHLSFWGGPYITPPGERDRWVWTPKRCPSATHAAPASSRDPLAAPSKASAGIATARAPPSCQHLKEGVPLPGVETLCTLGIQR
mmetsp:Transcript_37397/g.66653  ORF Transcript_37397/g.66653 Transcript_37397/m.66653 type:complete len:146 (-) Transcript_37397:556-993(-)